MADRLCFSRGRVQLLPRRVRLSRGELSRAAPDEGRRRPQPGQLHRVAPPPLPPQGADGEGRARRAIHGGRAGLYQGGHRGTPEELPGEIGRWAAASETDLRIAFRCGSIGGSVEAMKKGDKELRFCEIVLSEDPKNYHAWQHRQWAIETFE